MNSQKCSILLILQLEENNRTNLFDFLIERGFDVYHALNANEGILKARECSPNLIICQNEIDNKTGLQIFNLLYQDLIKKGTSFFVYMDEYCKEDVLIGLEMGVDNFIFLPFDETTMTRKIENQLGKVMKLRILESENFKLQFNSTPVAKFVSDGNQVIMMNPAFEKLTGIKNEKDKFPKIEELFDFQEKENDLINFRKCMNGLKDFCLFRSVLHQNSELLRFDIHLVCTDYLQDGLFMAEVVPAGTVNGNNQQGQADAGGSLPLHINGNAFNITVREQEVLEWSAQGLPIKQIAAILRISERTVEKHRANIMAKTQTSSIVEALYAIRKNMI